MVVVGLIGTPFGLSGTSREPKRDILSPKWGLLGPLGATNRPDTRSKCVVREAIALKKETVFYEKFHKPGGRVYWIS